MGDRLMATTGNRPYSGRPRPQRKAASDFDDPFVAPTAAERRRMDAEQSRPFREAHAAGRKEGATQARKTGGKPAAAKRPPARRPVPGARSARTAARQLQAPIRTQVTSGMRIFGLTLAVVALYNVLSPPGPQFFSGVLGGVSKALEWLSSPIAVPKRN